MNKYDDIINLPHYEFKYHKRQSMEARASQFSAFAALTGYSDLVKETSRLTDRKIELSEEEKNDLDRKLQVIKDNIKNQPEVIITYFISDKTKKGGKYEDIICNIKKIDNVNHLLVLTNNKKIYLKDIFNIKSKLFKEI